MKKVIYVITTLMLILITSCAQQATTITDEKPSDQKVKESAQESATQSKSTTTKALLQGLNVNSVWAYDASTNQVAFKVQVGEHPAHLVATDEYVFVANEGGNSVSVIDVEKKEIVKTIPVGKTPHGIGITNDEKIVAVANKGENTLSLIDTTNFEEITRIEVGQAPIQLAISPEDKYAFVTTEADKELVKVNLIIRQVVGEGLGTHVGRAALPGTPRDVDITNNDILFVANKDSNEVSVLSAIDMNPLKKFPIEVGQEPEGIAVDTISNLAFITNTGSDSVSIISIEELEVIKTINVGDMPQGIAINNARGERGYFYTANSGSNDISVVDISSMKTIDTLLAGIGPHNVAVSPDGRYFYVSMSG